MTLFERMDALKPHLSPSFFRRLVRRNPGDAPPHKDGVIARGRQELGRDRFWLPAEVEGNRLFDHRAESAASAIPLRRACSTRIVTAACSAPITGANTR